MSPTNSAGKALQDIPSSLAGVSRSPSTLMNTMRMPSSSFARDDLIMREFCSVVGQTSGQCVKPKNTSVGAPARSLMPPARCRPDPSSPGHRPRAACPWSSRGRTVGSGFVAATATRRGATDQRSAAAPLRHRHCATIDTMRRAAAHVAGRVVGTHVVVVGLPATAVGVGPASASWCAQFQCRCRRWWSDRRCSPPPPRCRSTRSRSDADRHSTARH